MKRLLTTLILLLLGGVPLAAAQPSASSPPVSPTITSVDADRSGVYYTTERRVTLFKTPSTDRPYLHLGFREPVYVVRSDSGWSHVRTQDGAQGYVSASTLSNVWVRVSKQKGMVYLYRGTQLIKKMPADFGYNYFADKQRRGDPGNPDHWRTPEGVFYVAKKNPQSTFYKALVLNYPTAEDARRGLRRGLISQDEFRAIVQAEDNFDMPPMHTDLGGWIEIHGDGTGGSTNWTQGCVAIQNRHMDQIWSLVTVGTPVLVER